MCPLSDPAKISEVGCVLASIISVVLGFVGIVLFVMLVIGGFKWLTSGGDPKGIEGAKATITNAIVGLLVIIFAYIILKIIETVTGIPVTKIPTP